MRHVIRALALATAVWLLLAPRADALAQPSAGKGEEIAARLCSRCHAVGRKGESPMGLAPPFRALSKRYPVENLAEAFAEGIVTGHPAMPRFVFSPPEIDALISYLQSLDEE
ncbi:MAG: cytochrome c [Hyphomicrobiaceae bacterium]|nr:cytochrome c [Hyphomicrobiaceae bacterium]